MSQSIVLASPLTVEIEEEPQPLAPDCVLSGKPVARCKSLVRSRDWSANMVVWECTAGRFNWHFTQDETIFVIDGETFFKDDKGVDRRLGAGDVGFFPKGTTCTFLVPDRIRKVAVVREPLWWPLGLGLKVWSKLLRTVGLAKKPAL